MRMGRATMDAYSSRRKCGGSDSPALMPRLLCTNSSTVILRFTCMARACNQGMRCAMLANCSLSGTGPFFAILVVTCCNQAFDDIAHTALPDIASKQCIAITKIEYHRNCVTTCSRAVVLCWSVFRMMTENASTCTASALAKLPGHCAK